jgi:thymidine kinase
VVIVAALDGDFMRKPFGRILELVPLAERVEKLTAVCMICHDREASFTKRRGCETEASDSFPLRNSPILLISLRFIHERMRNGCDNEV